MARNLDTKTLDEAAKVWAAHFNLPSKFSNRNEDVAVSGYEWAMQSLYKADYKDEFEYLLPKFKGRLGPDSLAEFGKDAMERFTPRSQETFEKILADKLAIDPDGYHIPGRIGTSVVGQTKVGKRVTRHGMQDARWPLYAGEAEERAVGNVRERGKVGAGADPLPPEDTFWSDEMRHLGIAEAYALKTNVSIAFAQAGIDAALDLMDEGSLGGVIQGWTGAQPVDPNAVDVGTLLFSATCSTTAFGVSTDAAPGALGTAAAITDDSSADNTGTVLYCRGSSSSVADTVLNSHIDGEAGTSGADFNFNTVAIVSGAVVSFTAWTVTQPQGPTAT